MADLSQTADNVLAVSSMPLETVIAGMTITAGMGVARGNSDTKWYASQANLETTAALHGIALGGAANNQPFQVAIGPGLINIGATLSVGKVYITSSSAGGGFRPVDDLTAGDYVSVAGIATTTSLLMFDPISSGVIAAANVT